MATVKETNLTFPVTLCSSPEDLPSVHLFPASWLPTHQIPGGHQSGFASVWPSSIYSLCSSSIPSPISTVLRNLSTNRKCWKIFTDLLRLKTLKPRNLWKIHLRLPLPTLFVHLLCLKSFGRYHMIQTWIFSWPCLSRWNCSLIRRLCGRYSRMESVLALKWFWCTFDPYYLSFSP